MASLAVSAGIGGGVTASNAVETHSCASLPAHTDMNRLRGESYPRTPRRTGTRNLTCRKFGRSLLTATGTTTSQAASSLKRKCLETFSYSENMLSKAGRFRAIRQGIHDARIRIGPRGMSLYPSNRQRVLYRRAWMRTNYGLSHRQLRIEWAHG